MLTLWDVIVVMMHQVSNLQFLKGL